MEDRPVVPGLVPASGCQVRTSAVGHRTCSARRPRQRWPSRIPATEKPTHGDVTETAIQRRVHPGRCATAHVDHSIGRRDPCRAERPQRHVRLLLGPAPCRLALSVRVVPVRRGTWLTCHQALSPRRRRLRCWPSTRTEVLDTMFHCMPSRRIPVLGQTILLEVTSACSKMNPEAGCRLAPCASAHRDVRPRA